MTPCVVFMNENGADYMPTDEQAPATRNQYAPVCHLNILEDYSPNMPNFLQQSNEGEMGVAEAESWREEVPKGMPSFH